MKRARLAITCALTAAFTAPAFSESELDLTVVNDAELVDELRQGTKGAAVLRAQVLLERAHFSPGEIDASFGANMLKAVRGFQKYRRLSVTGVVDERTWEALNRDDAPVLVEYAITDADLDHDFESIPRDMMEQAEMDALGFASPLEALSEKFHASPALLQRLNPGADMEEERQLLVVPNVDSTAPLPPAAALIVDKSDSTVSLADFDGRTFAQFPATTGSQHDPLPIGEWTIEVVARNPTFHYSPDLFWDADPEHAKAVLPPGPNNPVGVVWIDLSKEHYGIHGTPEPSNIGKTASHGCIRMTNWSARLVAEVVSSGTPAILRR